MDSLSHTLAQTHTRTSAAHFVSVLALVVAGGALHVWYLLDNCPLDLSGDEAHYWEWSRHPDLSYYSKGPLVAYIIWLGRAALGQWSTGLLGNEVLAVRLPAIVLSMLTGLGIYVLAVQTLRRPTLGLAAVAITFTVPILAVGSILMTIDAPLVCLWTWTLVAGHRALLRGGWLAWGVVAVLTALGILAKYTMVLVFPVVGLTMLFEPRFRQNLNRPGPYVALLLSLAGLVPILIWNAGHGWVSFRHVAGQAGLGGGPSIDLGGIFGYVAGQAAVVSPLWLAGMLMAVVALLRRPTRAADLADERASLRLLAIATLVPWVVFLGFSPLTKIQPNWPVLALVPGVVLVPNWLDPLLRGRSSRRGAIVFSAAAAITGGAMVLVAHRTDLLMPAFGWLARNAQPWELTPAAKYDPAARLRGWSQLGAAVGEALADERAAGRDPFILADDYQLASEIAFYCPGNPPVYSAQAALGGRRSQYDIWPNPLRDADRFLGRPVLYVGSLDPVLTEGDRPALPGLRPVRTVRHAVRGQTVRLWTIFVCDSFAGFPVLSAEHGRW